MESTYCPCCGDEMKAIMVACWTCYNLSDGLQPGTHEGFIAPLTAEKIASWDAARYARIMLDA